MGAPFLNAEKVMLVDAQGVAVDAAYDSVVVVARPADVLDYAANDVLGNAVAAGGAVLEFENIGPPDGHVVITKSTLRIDLAAPPAGMAGFTLHLYKETPPSALGDNVAWALPAGDRAAYLGSIDLGSPVAAAGVAATLYIKKSDLAEQFRVSAAGSLFAYLVTAAGYTPASGGTLAIGLSGIRA